MLGKKYDFKVISRFIAGSLIVTKPTFFAWDTNNNQASFRLIVIIVGFIFCFLALSYRLLIITSNSYNQSTRHQTKTHFRKEIVDRYGRALAVSLPSASLFANPRKVIDPEFSLKKLSKIIPDINFKKLSAELASDKSFVWIARDLTPDMQNKITDLGLAGFSFEREQKRIYPFGSATAHILGYVGRDLNGLAGLEKKYDKLLISEGSAEKYNEEANSKLELAIDARLQAIVSEELDNIIEQFRAKGGVVIVANPNNGEILSLVSKPDFDPHNPQKATNLQLFNSASQGVYEIGSVFKALTIAIALDSKSVSMHDAYDISYMKVGKFEVKDYHARHGWHSVAEIFLHSSNIGVAQIILETGKNNFKKYLKNLGLLDQLQIELPERATPLFPTESRWNDLGLVTMSYGYGISISPLHFVQAMLPVVNGGYLYPLTLLKQKDKIVANKIFDDDTSEQMRKMLRLVVKDGTGKRAEIKGYLVGGKTGTANKAVAGSYIKNSRISSFFGVLPSSNPKYVIYVMLDDPKATKETHGFATAGWNAAPLTNKIFERMIALYGLERIEDDSYEAQEMLNIDYKIENEV